MRGSGRPAGRPARRRVCRRCRLREPLLRGPRRRRAAALLLFVPVLQRGRVPHRVRLRQRRRAAILHSEHGISERGVQLRRRRRSVLRTGRWRVPEHALRHGRRPLLAHVLHGSRLRRAGLCLATHRQRAGPDLRHQPFRLRANGRALWLRVRLSEPGMPRRSEWPRLRGHVLQQRRLPRRHGLSTGHQPRRRLHHGLRTLDTGRGLAGRGLCGRRRLSKRPLHSGSVRGHVLRRRALPGRSHVHPD